MLSFPFKVFAFFLNEVHCGYNCHLSLCYNGIDPIINEKGKDNPLRNPTGHDFSAKLWSLEKKPSQFVGYSQVVETVGVGLSLGLMPEPGSKP